MEKLINGGRVAVVISPSFGAGWSTWNSHEKFLSMNKQIAEAVLNRDINSVIKICEEEFKGDSICYLGLSNCVIEWVPLGIVFEITEYDGAESIRVYNPKDWMTA